MAAFMTTFFGPDRVASKTRIDSLADLAKKGVDVPGFSNPTTPKTDPGDPHLDAKYLEGATKAVAPPPTAAGLKPQPRRTGMIAVGAAALLVGAGAVAGFGALRGRTTAPIEPEALVAVADAGTPAVVAVAPAPEKLDASEPIFDAGAQGVKVANTGPVTLTPALIMKVVRQHTASVSKCFEQNKDDLPSETGQMSVDFTINGAGRVSSAKSQLPDKKVGKCVEQVVSGMRFPVHKDKEVSLNLPFSYQVKR